MGKRKISELTYASSGSLEDLGVAVVGGVTVKTPRARRVWVDTVADLRTQTLSRLKGCEVKLGGYYAVGDVDMPPYRVVDGAAPGTYVDNGGSIIVPTGGDGSAAYLFTVNGDVRADTFGVIPENSEVENNPRFLASLTYAQSRGRVLYIPSGEYHLGDIQFSFSTPNWPFSKQRGIRGSGTNETVLYFNTPIGADVFTATGTAYWLVFEDFTARCEYWGGNSGNNWRLLEYNSNFINLSGGSSRLKIKRLNILGFRSALLLNTWVSEITQVEVTSCVYGISHISGTSTLIANCFVHDCAYSYLLALSVYQDDIDGDNTAKLSASGVSYSSVENCGAERSTKAAYSIGKYSGTLSSGAEIVVDTGSNDALGYVLFPLVVDGTGAYINTYIGESVITIPYLYFWTNLSSITGGPGLIHIEREGVKATIGDIKLSGSNGGANALKRILTFGETPTYCDINFNGTYQGFAIETIKIPRYISGIRFFGKSFGDVVLRGVAVPRMLSRSDAYFGKFETTITNWAGNENLYLALKGDNNTTQQSLIAVIHMIDHATAWSVRQTFVGQLIIRALWDPSNPTNPEVEYTFSGLNSAPDPCDVTLVATTEPIHGYSTGYEVKINPKNNDGFANSYHVADVKLTTNALWSTSVIDKIIIRKAT